MIEKTRLEEVLKIAIADENGVLIYPKEEIIEKKEGDKNDSKRTD